MKRFVFKLDAALRYRERIEDQRKREFAEVQVAFNRQRSTIEQLKAERVQGLDDLGGMSKGSLDVPVLMAQRRYLLGLERRTVKAVHVLEGMKGPLEEARVRLVNARKDVRVLERLRERQMERHLQDANREEQKVLDEIAQNVVQRKAEE